MINGTDNVEFELAAAGTGLEGSGINFDLLNSGPIKCSQGGEDAGFLASTARTVDEEMRKVGGGRLMDVSGRIVVVSANFLRVMRDVLRGRGGM